MYFSCYQQNLKIYCLWKKTKPVKEIPEAKEENFSSSCYFVKSNGSYRRFCPNLRKIYRKTEKLYVKRMFSIILIFVSPYEPPPSNYRPAIAYEPNFSINRSYLPNVFTYLLTQLSFFKNYPNTRARKGVETIQFPTHPRLLRTGFLLRSATGDTQNPLQSHVSLSQNVGPRHEKNSNFRPA